MESVIAIISLVASIIALVSTAKISRFQTVAPMRKEWIVQFRDALGQLFGHQHYAKLLAVDFPYRAKSEETIREMHTTLNLMTAGSARIQLMLNPNQRLHVEFTAGLRRCVDLTARYFFREAQGGSEAHELLISQVKAAEEVMRLGQLVIKEAWDQASKPEPLFPEFENR